MLLKETIVGYSKKYSRTPLFRINRDGEQLGYARIMDSWGVSLKIGYSGSLKIGCYCLRHVPTSRPFDHA